MCKFRTHFFHVGNARKNPTHSFHCPLFFLSNGVAYYGSCWCRSTDLPWWHFSASWEKSKRSCKLTNGNPLNRVHEQNHPLSTHRYTGTSTDSCCIIRIQTAQPPDDRTNAFMNPPYWSILIKTLYFSELIVFHRHVKCLLFRTSCA